MELSIQYSLSEKWLPAESLEVYQDFMEPAELLKFYIFLTAMFNFKVYFILFINGYSSSH